MEKGEYKPTSNIFTVYYQPSGIGFIVQTVLALLCMYIVSIVLVIKISVLFRDNNIIL